MKELIAIIFSVGYLYSQIVITEIMYDLPGPDSPNEFIEIFNFSDSLSFDISTFEIRDKYGTDQLIPAGLPLLLPLQYGLILEGDHKLEESIYSEIMPPSTPCFFVDDLSIGNGLSASDSIYIMDSGGITMDSVGWDLSLPPGFSYERINIDNYQGDSYWSASLDSLGSPGRANTNEPNKIDGAITGVYLSTGSVFEPGQVSTFRVLCRNIGLESINGYLKVYLSGKLITTLGEYSIEPNDSIYVDIVLESLPSGINEILLDLDILGDEDRSNNFYNTIVNVRYETGVIKLNEFLHKPGDYGFEFIEIQSCSNEPINLNGWKFRDKTKTSSPVNRNIFLLNGEYFVFGSDSMILNEIDSTSTFISTIFPSLNNSGDSIYLLDPFDTVIDSLGYDISWQSDHGISYEKIIKCSDSDIPENWMVSMNGITPGQYNSVSPRWSDGKLIKNSFYSRPQFPNEYEQFQIGFNIVNAGEGPLLGKLNVNISTLPVFDRQISIPKYLDTTEYILKVPGLRSGINIVDINLIVPDDTIYNNTISETVRVRYPAGSLLINEFLPSPNNEMCEFIEIIAKRDLTLNGWKLGDGSRSSIDLGNEFLLAGDLCLIAEDSSIYQHMTSSVPVIIPSFGWPSLNNTSDSLWIKGPGGGGLERVKFDSSWHIVSGRSLERVSESHLSSSSYNWKPSVHINGFTPGTVNSLHLSGNESKSYSISLQNNLFSPDGDGRNDNLIIEYRSPLPYLVLNLSLHTLAGIPVWEDYSNTYVPGSGMVTWDGKSNNGNDLPVGIYLIKGELINSKGRVKLEYFDSFILARKL